ncbi:MAG: TPM domain-containing protein [Candidatus Omnitrophota bacterium]
MRSTHGLLLAAFLLVLVPGTVLALKVLDRPKGYVTDEALMLSSAGRSKLEEVLADFDRETTHQLIVVTLPGLEGDSLEAFSMRLAEAWRPGRKDKDNGIIFLIFKKDRKMRLEVGYGLEGVLTDALTGQILREIVTPPFKSGDYERGIMAGVEAVIRVIRGESQAQRDAPGSSGSTPGEMEAERRAQAVTLIVILGAAALVSFLDFFRYFDYRRSHLAYAARYDFWEWWWRFALLLAILNLLFRVLLSVMLRSGGGYSGGRGSGGGFSGGGGGFGGGGASGSW